jgi:hypothetical protein
MRPLSPIGGALYLLALTITFYYVTIALTRWLLMVAH